MGIEPTCRLVTGTLVLKTRRPTRTPALPWKIIYYVQARLSMRKWKINNGSAVIPKIIDGDKKLTHHNNPVVTSFGRQGEHIAMFLEASGQKEETDFENEVANSGNTMLFCKFIEIKGETE